MKVVRYEFNTDAPRDRVASTFGEVWTSGKRTSKHPVHEIADGYVFEMRVFRDHIKYSVHLANDGDRTWVQTRLMEATVHRSFSIMMIPLSPKVLRMPWPYRDVMKQTMTKLAADGFSVVDTSAKLKWP